MHRFTLHLSNGQSYTVGVGGKGKLSDAVDMLRASKRAAFMVWFVDGDKELAFFPEYTDKPCPIGVVIEMSSIVAFEVLA